MDAVDNLGDAIDVTRNLLLPIRPWLWLKLAIVVLFVAGLGFGGGVPSDPTFVSEFDDPAVEEPTPEDELPGDPAVEDPTAEPDLSDEEIMWIGLIIIGLILLGIGLWFLFALLGGIAEFVFIESLRTQQVSIWQYTKRHFWRGLRLFGFRLGIAILTLLVIGIPTLALFFLIGAADGELFAILGVAVLLWIVVALVESIVNRFTSEFVAPIMLLETRGVLSGWRRFWPTLRSHWKEYVVYLLLVWVLQLVINIAAAFVMGFGLILLAIPVVLLLLLLTLLGGIGLILAIPVVLLAALLALMIVALVQMPIRTYFQYYALLLLGDTNADLDLIPDQRAAVRSGDNGRGPGPAGGPGATGGPDDPDGPGGTGPTESERRPDRGWDDHGTEGSDDVDDGTARDDDPTRAGDSYWDGRTDSWGGPDEEPAESGDRDQRARRDQETDETDPWERDETEDASDAADDETAEDDEDAADGRGW